MGSDAGTPNPRKNSEVSTDTDSNAYHVWTGADEGVYMSRSTDSGETWEQESIRISPQVSSRQSSLRRMQVTPVESLSPTLVARTRRCSINPILTAILGMGTPITLRTMQPITSTSRSVLNALDENPTFHTYRVTDDPVQVGSICLNSGDCRDMVVQTVTCSISTTCTLTDKDVSTLPLLMVAQVAVLRIRTLPQQIRGWAWSVYYLASGPSLYVADGDLNRSTDSNRCNWLLSLMDCINCLNSIVPEQSAPCTLDSCLVGFLALLPASFDSFFRSIFASLYSSLRFIKSVKPFRSC